MPANTNPIFKGTAKAWTLELDTADGTTAIALVAAGSSGSLIDTIVATSTDTAVVELDLYLNDGTSDFTIGSVTIAAGGRDGGTTASVDILNQSDLPWVRDALSLALENGHTLKAGAHAAITAAKVVHLVAFGGDY